MALTPEYKRRAILRSLELSLGSFSCLLDEADRVLNGLDLFSCVIWNFDSEFFFESHNQLNGVEAVCAQIVDEACVFGYFRAVDTEVLNNDFFDAVVNCAHFYYLMFR